MLSLPRVHSPEVHHAPLHCLLWFAESYSNSSSHLAIGDLNSDQIPRRNGQSGLKVKLGSIDIIPLRAPREKVAKNRSSNPSLNQNPPPAPLDQLCSTANELLRHQTLLERHSMLLLLLLLLPLLMTMMIHRSLCPPTMALSTRIHHRRSAIEKLHCAASDPIGAERNGMALTSGLLPVGRGLRR